MYLTNNLTKETQVTAWVFLLLSKNLKQEFLLAIILQFFMVQKVRTYFIIFYILWKNYSFY